MEVKFWKDKDKKQIDPEIFSLVADKLAKTIYEEGSGTGNKPTQIRKFYDEVVRFDNIIKTNPAEFNAMLPYLKMLNAKAAYAMGRDLVSKGFKDFISNSLKQISDRDDFNVFASLFEAFMGYYKYYDEKVERSRGGAR
jgi:CRISPR-associated protein Csm2